MGIEIRSGRIEDSCLVAVVCRTCGERHAGLYFLRSCELKKQAMAKARKNVR